MTEAGRINFASLAGTEVVTKSQLFNCMCFNFIQWQHTSIQFDMQSSYHAGHSTKTVMLKVMNDIMLAAWPQDVSCSLYY